MAKTCKLEILWQYAAAGLTVVNPRSRFYVAAGFRKLSAAGIIRYKYNIV